MIGLVLLIAGILVIIIGSLLGTKSDVKIGVGGFIGPIPFGWANDPRLMPWIIAITMVIAVVFLLMTLKNAGTF